jgi:hypothetical protein
VVSRGALQGGREWLDGGLRARRIRISCDAQEREAEPPESLDIVEVVPSIAEMAGGVPLSDLLHQASAEVCGVVQGETPQAGAVDLLCKAVQSVVSSACEQQALDYPVGDFKLGGEQPGNLVDLSGSARALVEDNGRTQCDPSGQG